jgi:hypothetical protein
MQKNTILLIIYLAIVSYSLQASLEDSAKVQTKKLFHANAGTLGLWFTADPALNDMYSPVRIILM